MEREFNEAHDFGQRSPLPDPSDLANGLFPGDAPSTAGPGGPA